MVFSLFKLDFLCEERIVDVGTKIVNINLNPYRKVNLRGLARPLSPYPASDGVQP